MKITPLLRKYRIAFSALELIASGQVKHCPAHAREAMQRCIDIAETEADQILTASRDNVPIDSPRRQQRNHA